MPKAVPRSSVGTSSSGSWRKRRKLPASRPRAASSTAPRQRSAAASDARYARSSPSKKESNERLAQLRVTPCSGWSIREHIMGVRVSATKAESATAKARVRPNSRNSRPTLPVRNATGMNTATRATVVAMTAKPISRTPSTAACRRDLPISRWR